MSMCCIYWLMNKLAWPIPWEKQSRVREKPWSYQRQTLGTLSGQPQPGGDIQINRSR